MWMQICTSLINHEGIHMLPVWHQSTYASAPCAVPADGKGALTRMKPGRSAHPDRAVLDTGLQLKELCGRVLSRCLELISH